MRKIFFIIFISCFLIFNFSMLVNYSSAAAWNTNTPVNTNQGGSGNKVNLSNPLGYTSPNTLIGKVINGALGIVGSIALAMFIYGGLTWMTAAGNNEKTQKGKDILIWATLGLIVIFSSASILSFIFRTL